MKPFTVALIVFVVASLGVALGYFMIAFAGAIVIGVLSVAIGRSQGAITTSSAIFSILSGLLGVILVLVGLSIFIN